MGTIRKSAGDQWEQEREQEMSVGNKEGLNTFTVPYLHT
jgi:hypothetical protein